MAIIMTSLEDILLKTVLIFEVVSRRHEKKSILMTTNKPFNE